MNTTVTLIIVIIVCIAILAFWLIRRRRGKSAPRPSAPQMPAPPTFDVPPPAAAPSEPLPPPPPMVAPSAPPMFDFPPPAAAPRPLPIAPSPTTAREYRVSITHPKLLSKGYASLFIVQIYLPLMHLRATRIIAAEFGAQKVAEHTWDVELSKGSKIRIKLSSPVLSFSDPVIKRVENGLAVARFTAIPNDNCRPGTHYAMLSITDVETQLEYESLSFAVQVADFAFDHVSRPLLSKAMSVVLGIGSLTMFVLTGLEQVDKTLGLTAGTTAAVLTSAILARFWSLFQQPKVTHTP